MRQNPPAWLENAVFYQIYPQSFYDTNNDGVGDLAGIIQKLDYLQAMGFNALWLNPIFVSSFMDAGYDITDYYRVAPRYGTNADARRLFAEAKKRGIRVCLDLVPGHSSMEHPWFIQSAQAKRNKYSDRYIWAEGAWGNTEPGLNLIAGFGQRPLSYVANYYYTQPALNYGFAHPDPKKPWQLSTNHPAAKATSMEMLNIMRYWMNMGASGFRVDMAGSLVKLDPEQKATIRLWQGLSSTLKREYPEAVLISEWANPARSIRAGFDIDFFLHFGPYANAYNSLFRLGPSSFFHPSGKGNLRSFLPTYRRHFKAARHGYISVPSGNHDMNRISLGRSPEDLKICFAFLLTLPGLPFIYYGDEIGMAYQPDLPSKEGGYTRTGSRTPMQWKNGKNKGFSNTLASKLYLPVDHSKGAPDVASQEGKNESLLETIRTLILLRKMHPALQAKGFFKVMADGSNRKPLVYLRHKGNEKILVILQPSSKKVRLKLRLTGKPFPLLTHKMELTPKGELKASGVSFGLFRLS